MSQGGGQYRKRSRKEIREAVRAARRTDADRSAARMRAFTDTQAQRIVDRFGGVIALWRVLNEMPNGKKLSKSTIYRWLYAVDEGGTGGVIPSNNWPYIIAAGRYAGILFEPSDFMPTPQVQSFESLPIPRSVKDELKRKRNAYLAKQRRKERKRTRLAKLLREVEIANGRD